ncbi:MAG: hypothetical protein JXR37_00065 [Kiritimatiellae bacterium]|nr:hypothetical protein [Kiritimatiellia bacterium]
MHTRSERRFTWRSLAALLALSMPLLADEAAPAGRVVLFRKGDAGEITRRTDRDAGFFPFLRGGIPCVTYSLPAGAKGIPPELPGDLAQAKLIWFGDNAQQYWSGSPSHLFRDSAVRAAVRQALGAGAVLFFDYHGYTLENTAKTGLADLFKELNVPLPGELGANTRQYYAARFAADDPLLSAYTKIGEHRFRGYGWWPSVPARYVVVARPSLDKTGAALIAARSVLGKGTLVFNQVYSLLRGNTAFGDNLAAVAFGRDLTEEIKKGGTVANAGGPAPRASAAPSPAVMRLAAKTFFPPTGPNTLYGANMERLPWTEPDATARIACMAYEPTGLARYAEPLSGVVTLDGADPESLKVRTPRGVTLARQVRPLDGDKAEVFFHMPLGAYETAGFFIYRGGKKEPPGESHRRAVIRQLDDGTFLMENDFVRVILDSMGVLRYLAPRNGTGLNNVAHYGTYLSPGYGNRLERYWEKEVVSARITEPGPVRAAFAVEMREKDQGAVLTIRYSLGAESPLLIETTGADKRLEVQREHKWAPFGDLANDTVYYMGPNGLRTLPMERVGYKVYGDLLPHMEEDWYAVADARGECVGEFFEREKTRRMAFDMHGMGILTHENMVVDKDDTALRAICSLNGTHADVYARYILWKNPPRLFRRGWQARSAALLSRSVPQFGREPLSWMFLWDNWFRRTAMPTDPVETAKRLIQDVKYQGCDGILLCMHGNELIGSSRFNAKTLVELAHPEGIAVMAAPYTKSYRDLGLKPDKQYVCHIRDRDTLAHFFRELAGTGVDYISLGDEQGPQVSSEILNPLFKQKTGKEWNIGIKNFEQSDTPEKGERNMFKAGILVDWVHDMTRVVKSVNPNCIVSIITSPNNHNRLDGFADVERFIPPMDVGCTDLYGAYISGGMKYMTAYMRACAGNGMDASPLLIACCNMDPHHAWNNLNANLLAGNVNLIYYGYGYGRRDRLHLDLTRRFFHWRTLSGLGRYMMQTAPHALYAIAYDHEAFMDSVLKGEHMSEGTGSVRYNRNIARLCGVKGFRADLLMKRGYKPETLAPYEAVIIPGGHAATKGFPETVRRYVENGGTAVLAGDALKIPAFAELAGVTVGPLRSTRVAFKGLAGSLTALQGTYPGEIYTLERRAGDASALVDSDEGVVVLKRAVGKGVAAACLMATSYEELLPRVVYELTGGPSVAIEGGDSSDLETALFRGTDDHVVGLFNPRSGKPRDVAFRLKRSVRSPTYAVDLKTGGHSAAQDGVYRVRVPAGEVGFFLLADQLPDAAMAEHPHGSGRPAKTGVVPRPLEPAAVPGAAHAARAARTKEPDQLYVGVLHSEERTDKGRQLVKGGRFLRDTLSQRRGLVVDLLPDLKAATLADYDVIVIPNTGSPAKPTALNEDWKQVVRAFVEQGGGALLCHHACGFPATFGAPVFPEIADVTGYVPLQDMKILADHAVASGQAMRDFDPKRANDPAFAHEFNDTVMKKDELFGASYPDYISLRARPGAVVVALSEKKGAHGNDDVVVAGTYGKGRVVLCGLCLGTRLKGAGRQAAEEDYLSEGERKLLINSVYWLGYKGFAQK